MSVRWRYFFLGADLQWTIGPCVDPSDDQRGCLEFCDAGAGCLLARKQTMCHHLPYSTTPTVSKWLEMEIHMGVVERCAGCSGHRRF